MPLSQNNQPSTSTSTTADSSGAQNPSIWLGYQDRNPEENTQFFGGGDSKAYQDISDDIIASGASSHATTEPGMHTDALVGDMFVQAVTIEYQGMPTIVFAFPVRVDMLYSIS